MFFRKITCRSNGKEYAYVKLIENYREGGKVKQRVVANLGNIDNLTPERVEGLVAGLRKICGCPHFSSQQVCSAAGKADVSEAGLSEMRGLPGDSAQLKANKVLRYGEVFIIHKIWEIIGLRDAVEETFSGRSSDLNITLLVELMVMNQIIKPLNKQVISDWYHCLYLPELEGKELLPHHFYRALDLIARDKKVLEKRVLEKMKSKDTADTDIVFYRLTTATIEPSPHDELNMSSYGKYFFAEPAKEINVDLGILISRNGMPFGGRMLQKTADETGYSETVNYLKSNYGVQHCIFVGERNSTVKRDLDVLIALGYEYLVRRKPWRREDIELIKTEAAPGRDNYLPINDELWFREVRKGEIRFLFCFNPQVAESHRALLKERQEAVESELKAIEQAVDESRYGIPGQPFNKNASIFKDEYCLRYFDWRYDKDSKKFTYRRRDDLLERDLDLAGLFVLESNSSALSGRELVESYINSTQIGEFFRKIKNFEVRPNKLKANLDISANILVCVLAAIIEKILERIVRGAGVNLSPGQTLQVLEEIKVTVNQVGGREVKSITRIDKIQAEILRAVGVINL